MEEQHRFKWLGLFALLPGVAIVFMDQSILPVALPTIQREFGANNIALQWTVNAYLLAIASFVLLAGKFTDRLGARRAFLTGMFWFIIASVFCGISFNIQWLIIARFVQGMGAALMFPSQGVILNRLFPAHQRGRATGLNISIGSLFLIIAPLVGGYLTEIFSWRYIFWINLPIAAIGFILAFLFLPKIPPVHKPVDGRGFFYFMVGSSASVITLMQARTWGWFSPPTLLLAIAAVAGFVLLLQREKKIAHPFLDLHLFKKPIFSAISLSICSVQFSIMICVFWAIYFQTVLKLSPYQAGVLGSLSGIPSLFLASIVGYLSDKINPKWFVGLGFLILISTCFWFASFPLPTLSQLIIAVVAFGFGIPLIFTPSYSSVSKIIDTPHVGVAFGMISTLRQFSGTLGLALIGSYMNGVVQHHLKTGSIADAEIAGFQSTHFALGWVLIAVLVVLVILKRRAQRLSRT